MPNSPENCTTCGHWVGAHGSKGCRTLSCHCPRTKTGQKTVTVTLPPTTMPTPPEHPYLAEWWPETDASPWSVSIFDGKPRVDFDGTDNEPNFRLNAGLQVHPTGEHWPFILLDTKHATLLAAHLLAAVDHIERTSGQ